METFNQQEAGEAIMYIGSQEDIDEGEMRINNMAESARDITIEKRQGGGTPKLRKNMADFITDKVMALANNNSDNDDSGVDKNQGVAGVDSDATINTSQISGLDQIDIDEDDGNSDLEQKALANLQDEQPD